MYIPGVGRCSALLHLWVQYPKGMTIGALGIVLGTCYAMYPHDTPLQCDEFGGTVQTVTAVYTETTRLEDWCVLPREEVDAELQEMIKVYPDFLIHDPLM